MGKTIFHHEALNDISKSVSEVNQLRILNNENAKKAEEDLQQKNSQKIA